MSFTSTIFIFIFLPIALLLFGILKKLNVNNNIISAYILIISLSFFAWSGLSGLIVTLILTLINYLVGLRISKSIHSKTWMIVGILLNTSVLVIYKYTNFIINSIRSLMNLETVLLPIPAAPLGLSFFTFMSIAYLADIYTKKIKALNNPLLFYEYALFFPKVSMGPITRVSALESDLKTHPSSWNKAYEGVIRFCTGFSKKILLSNQMAFMADQAFNSTVALTPAYAWLGILAYSLQIYLDFSAYSDMAIGLGNIFGITIIENFDYPYISKSIKEFWRRWHISLSHWFRNYIYIPLGGNRKGNAATYRNLMIVFFLTGLWHGASWNFIVWGLFFGVFLLLERAGLDKILEKLPAVLQHLYALFVVMIGWVFFRADTLGNALIYLKCMFGITVGTMNNLNILTEITPHFIFFLIISILACTPLFKKILHRFESCWIRDFLIFAVFILALGYMVSSSYNPFIYTRF